MEESIEFLQQKRKSLSHKLEKIGDFRRGIISVNYRKCGKRTVFAQRKDIPVMGLVISGTQRLKGRAMQRTSSWGRRQKNISRRPKTIAIS